MEKKAAKLTQPKRDTTKYRPKNIPIWALIEYADKGLTCKEIGELVGCHGSTVAKRLRKHGYRLSTLKDFKRHRADVFAYTQARIIEAISDKDLATASLQQKATSIGILHDKERLQRDQSTHNLATVSTTLEAIQAELHTLDNEEKELMNNPIKG